MTEQPDPTATPAPAADGHVYIHHYEIRVQGRLLARWSAWFDGFDVVAGDDGITVIRGVVADQSALHGLLQKVRDIGLPLLSLTQLPPGTATGDTNPERS